MSNREKVYVYSRFSNSASQLNLELHTRDLPFSLSRELLAAKSAKVAALLEKNVKDDISEFLRHIPSTPETFELVAKFCHGYEAQISTENVLPLACLAFFLEMTENHSKNNLLEKVLTFLEQRVLPSWNETIKALLSIDNLHQAKEIGLFDACLESIVEKAQLDPRLLGEPIKTSNYVDGFEVDNNAYRPNARRKLFVLDWKSEDLTTLPVQLYEPIVHAMNQHGIPQQYVTASICKYAEKWVLSCSTAGEKMPIHKRNSQREVIEAVERLLPNERALLPSSLLFDMLRFAILLGASSDCTNGFESRIGNQLDQAKVNDLFISCQGNAEEVQYDLNYLRRILKNFYRNYTSSDPTGLQKVAELVEELLGEVASDKNLGASTFVSLAELSIAASLGTQRSSDGIYRAIDIYFVNHKSLTESEREEICQILDCNKMSPEALEHAAKNERLPLRVVVQVLFVGQLQLRDRIATEFQAFDQKLRDDEVRGELELAETTIEKVNEKVTELERDSQMMRKKIEQCRSHRVARKDKVSVWTQMKRKFGCISSLHECNSRVNKKKVHP